MLKNPPFAGFISCILDQEIACSSRVGEISICDIFIASGDFSGRIKAKGLLGLHTRSLTALSGHSGGDGGWHGSLPSGQTPGNAHLGVSLSGNDVCVQI